MVGQTWSMASSRASIRFPARSDFERFFAGFPRPSVARDIFYCLEDGRVDFLLRHTYRGLAPHIERIIQDGLASRPPLAGRPLWGAALEMLLHLCCVGGLSLQVPPVVVPLARFLHGVAARVRQPQATVYDSAVATVEVYRLLEQLPNVHVAALDDTSIDGEIVMLGEAVVQGGGCRGVPRHDAVDPCRRGSGVPKPGPAAASR